MKGKTITVSAQRIINLGNYRSLHVGGSIEIELEETDKLGAADAWAEAEKSFLRRVNDIADNIEDQVHSK